jgi:hypothetical protein
MVEQKCKCPTRGHGHAPGQCDKPATREDERCDVCRDLEAKQAAEAVQMGNQPSASTGMTDAVSSTTAGKHEPPSR